IAVAHGIPYAATSSIAYPGDYIAKVSKAIVVDGPALGHVLATCPLGWGSEPSDSIKLARLAVQTRIFPIYEVIEGRYKLNVKVSKPVPVEEYLKLQRRFQHLFRPEFKDELEEVKRMVEERWNRILELCGEKPS
ncbi:MAG: pyruvate ferredoxin oxidoreductase, partial [Candidatus Bathyarchaeota archaeon]|nr:pyruvate ferredoxin oxidoreductase [Candidatus Bathyarchaeota archaeon]